MDCDRIQIRSMLVRSRRKTRANTPLELAEHLQARLMRVVTPKERVVAPAPLARVASALRGRQLHAEHRADPRRALHLDAPVVRVDDRLDYGETEPGSTGSPPAAQVGPREALEYAPELIRGYPLSLIHISEPTRRTPI